MKKDIYIIKNTINDMCYVGQSVDYQYRFKKHKEEARRSNYHYKSLLYNAMNKNGIENFYVELLESQIKNYNEREKYWIKKLNTIRPNGYNLSDGGDWYPNLDGVLHHAAKINNQEDLESIYSMLLNGEMTIKQIAQNFNVEDRIIKDINSGLTYKNKKLSYPLRELILTKDKFNRLIYDLKYSNYSYLEISELYGISWHQVKAINYGNSQKQSYISYPIRNVGFNGEKKDKEKVMFIQNDLLSTKIPLIDLARKYNCSQTTIWRINIGEEFINLNFKYPLRNTNKLIQKEVNEIHGLLKNSKISINEIAEKFLVSTATIKRINNGDTKKYYDENYTYPLRK